MVEFSMLVFRNEYVALLQRSKMSSGWHSGNLYDKIVIVCEMNSHRTEFQIFNSDIVNL